MGMDDPNVTNFWIEPGAMKIALVKGDLKNYMLEGSATDKEAKELEQQKEPIMKKQRRCVMAGSLIMNGWVKSTRSLWLLIPIHTLRLRY